MQHKRPASRAKPGNYVPATIAVSAAIVVLISALVLLPGYQGASGIQTDLTFMPRLNALLNVLTLVFLTFAWRRAKQKNVESHRRWIFAALSTTFLFLLSYIIYHFMASSTPYGGEGWLRPVYFSLLISHILLAVGTIPLTLLSMFSGLRMQVTRHRAFARWAMPLWMYTNASGIIVYLMISPYY